MQWWYVYKYDDMMPCCYTNIWRGWDELRGDDNDRLGWQDSPTWDLFRLKHDGDDDYDGDDGDNDDNDGAVDDDDDRLGWRDLPTWGLFRLKHQSDI